MKVLKALFLIFLSIGINSCENDVIVQGLDEAKSKWITLNPSKYKFDYDYGWECLAEFIPAEIVVEDDMIIEINDPNNGQALEYDNGTTAVDSLPWSFYTINELFDKLDEANSKAFNVDVVFNEENGYPIFFYIDWNEKIIDEEISYSVSDFEVL